jgi:hypothetical protein
MQCLRLNICNLVPVICQGDEHDTNLARKSIDLIAVHKKKRQVTQTAERSRQVRRLQTHAHPKLPHKKNKRQENPAS